jgi:hypothetical protein
MWNTIFAVTWDLGTAVFRLIFHPLDSVTLVFLVYSDMFVEAYHEFGVAVLEHYWMMTGAAVAGAVLVVLAWAYEDYAIRNARLLGPAVLIPAADVIPRGRILFGDGGWSLEFLRRHHLQYDKTAAAA